MKQTTVPQTPALGWLSLSFKVFLFVIPPILIEKVFPHGHYVFSGASYIAGALLQALWPPRTYRLPLILGVATAAAIGTPLIAHFAGWN